MLLVGGTMLHILQTLVLGSLISVSGKKKMSILGAKPNKHLDEVIRLIESGKVIPVIDKRYSLDEVSEALRYLGDGRCKGKVVITLDDKHTSSEGESSGNK